jgi:hypothetical protein
LCLSNQNERSEGAVAEPSDRLVTSRSNLRPRPPWKPGESGNPAGMPSNRTRLAREIAERAGLGAILALARKVKANEKELAEALIKMAQEGEGENGTGRATAQRLIHDLLGSLKKRDELKVEHSLEVQVVRKVRIMPGAEDDAREVEIEGGGAPARPEPQGPPLDTYVHHSLEGGEEPDPNPSEEVSAVLAVPADHAHCSTRSHRELASSGLGAAEGREPPRRDPPLPPWQSGAVMAADAVEGGADPRGESDPSAPALKSVSAHPPSPPEGLAPSARAENVDALGPDQDPGDADHTNGAQDVGGNGDARVGKLRPPK